MLAMSNRIENAREELNKWQGLKGSVAAYPEGDAVIELVLGSLVGKTKVGWLTFVEEKIELSKKDLEKLLELQKNQEKEAPTAADKDIEVLKAMAVKDPQFSNINEVGVGSGAQHEKFKDYSNIKNNHIKDNNIETGLRSLRRKMYGRKVNIFVSGLAQRVSLADAWSINLQNAGESTLHILEYPGKSMNVVLEL